MKKDFHLPATVLLLLGGGLLQPLTVQPEARITPSQQYAQNWHIAHRETFDHSKTYTFVEISQNNQQRGQAHWENVFQSSPPASSGFVGGGLSSSRSFSIS